MDNAVSHHLSWCSASHQAAAATQGNSPWFYCWVLMQYDIEYPFGHFELTVLLVSLLGFFAPLAFLVTGQHDEQKRPWLTVSTGQQQLKHPCNINIILILNAKCSTIPATRKKK